MKAIGSKEDFKNWLLRFNPEDIVGESCSGNSCPLARYSESDEVDGSVYWDIKTQSYEDMPDWGSGFIWHVDNHFQGSNVTARKALEILETCGEA